MVRTQIQLTEQQARLVRQVAAERNVSMAEVIRQGLDQFLATAVSVDQVERRRRALALAGRFHSGRSDTSEAHDDAFAETIAP